LVRPALCDPDGSDHQSDRAIAAPTLLFLKSGATEFSILCRKQLLQKGLRDAAEFDHRPLLRNSRTLLSILNSAAQRDL
jgi:hypothetical protein